MKGIIFNSLEEQILDRYGMTDWNEILSEAGSRGIFIAGESYSDKQLQSLIEVIQRRLGIGRTELVRHFGYNLFIQLLRAHPFVCEEISTLEQLLTELDSVIHSQVKKLYDSPNLPGFSHFYKDENTLVMIYRSPRQLCVLAEGLIAGAANYFDQPIRLRHPTCTHRGADYCELVVEFIND